MRHVIALSVLLACLPAAQAQLGPTDARIISRPMPSKAPASRTFSAEAELLVAADGDVDSVTLVASSGDEDFDKHWRKSMSDWQFVPAVDENGLPQQSTTRVFYKLNNLVIGETTRNAVTESQRIERMTCKDFDWEYRIVSDALARRFALLDPLLKTPQIMLVAERKPSPDQLELLNERYDRIVSDVVRHCRGNPDDPVWQAVLKPAMEAALTAP